ncbi:MAG: hypothetical protein LPD71_05855 [Shewanella sp.]|nr:hypothetical protein [Shewanella sp.]MCF1459608.1 hypothetical protein [Shewanella sp.]
MGKKTAVGLLASLGVVGTASATEEGVAAITALSAEATALFGAAWPVIVVVTGGIIGIKLFKKIASRAT